MMWVIASHQMRSLRRQRVFAVLFGTLLVMTAVAGAIGWSSRETISRVYGVAVSLLADAGRPAPPNPIVLKPTLALLSNMVVYIPLIGALLAIVLGHLAIADDESNGVGRLLFSRQISRWCYLAGKILAAAIVLLVTVAACLVVSVVALMVVNRAAPSAGDLGRLVAFYGLSWLYLLAFALIGIVCALVAGRRSLALLSALGSWLVITFVLPQLTSGLRPTTSLNPINDPVSTSQGFFRFTARLRFLSIAEQYKTASARALQTSTDGSVLSGVASSAVLVAVLALLAVGLVQHHDYARSMSHE